MIDKIVVTGLRVFGHHGITEDERDRGQDFLVDVEISADLSRASTSDAIEDTLDYSGVVKEAQRIVSVERFRLLEALANRIAEAILENPIALSVVVRVAKPEPPIDAELDSVGVEIRRWRR
jgi:dihydroneopterin aldolase